VGKEQYFKKSREIHWASDDSSTLKSWGDKNLRGGEVRRCDHGGNRPREGVRKKKGMKLSSVQLGVTIRIGKSFKTRLGIRKKETN